MASGYRCPTIGRGRIWRNEKNETSWQYRTKNVEEKPCNANIQDHFVGITREPWSFYQSSTGGSDDPLSNAFKFESDDEIEDEKNVKTNVMSILSSTCNYLKDIDNFPTSTCGEAGLPSFDDAYNSSSLMTPKHQRETGIAITPTDPMKNKILNAHCLEESPVNKLEEISKCNKLSAPSYALHSQKQTAKGFVAVCEFLDYVARGYGNSQNEAREEAAVKMLQNLDIDDDDDDDASSKYDYGFEHSFQDNFIQEKDQNNLQGKAQNECKASDIRQTNSNFKGLKNFQRDCSQQKPGNGSHYQFPELAMRPTGNKQYVWLLQSVAAKMNFEVKYETVPHRTSTGLAQCLVHLCKDPPLVCYGCAKSENKAKSSAARCAFEYLKLVYQK